MADNEGLFAALSTVNKQCSLLSAENIRLREENRWLTERIIVLNQEREAVTRGATTSSDKSTSTMDDEDDLFEDVKFIATDVARSPFVKEEIEAKEGGEVEGNCNTRLMIKNQETVAAQDEVFEDIFRGEQETSDDQLKLHKQHCNVCYYSTLRVYNMKRHMRTHTGEKPYQCTICNYCASDASSLKFHMRGHTGEKPYQCTICNYSSTHNVALKNHMKTYTGKKPYQCTICDYSALQPNNLKCHMRTHTGEKSYQCTICNYSSSQNGALKQHMRTHTGEKPYQCTICVYSTSLNSAFKSHMRTHTGEKPYHCTVCDYSARQSYHLKRHMLIHAVLDA